MNLKDEYNKTFIESLANHLKIQNSSFDERQFTKTIINKNWEAKELKERIRCVTENLNQFLPYSYVKQIELLSKIVSNYGGLQGFVFPDFVQV